MSVDGPTFLAFAMSAIGFGISRARFLELIPVFTARNRAPRRSTPRAFHSKLHYSGVDVVDVFWAEQQHF